MNKWVRRKRNSWGFGIQSPNDFYFVQHVLREKMAYYAYDTIHTLTSALPASQPHYSEEIYRLLFRLTNHMQPHIIVEMGTGTGLSACAMVLARPTATCITIDRTHPDSLQEMPEKLLAEYPHIISKKGDEIGIFRQILAEEQRVDLLHVALTSYYKEAVELAMPYTNDNTLFVIEGIHENPEKQAWWKALQEESGIGISYDLGKVGLLFFDHTRHKDKYWIHLRNH